jgi:hypothetical protein
MSLNDPYFDDWVRDKIKQLEAKTPDHLWESIRDSSRFYIIVDRNKYLLAFLLLIVTTGAVGYWAFHPQSATAPHNIVSTQRAHPIRPASPSTNNSMAGLTTELPVKNNTAHQLAASRSESALGPAAPHSESALSLAASRSESALGSAAPRSESTVGPASASALGTVEPLDNPYKTLSLAAQDPGTTILSKPATSAELHKSAGMAIPVSLQSASRRKVYWEVFAGPDHVAHFIKATTTQYETYVEKVRATESSYPSFSMGLKADFPVLGVNWRMQVGLRFSQINEELNYTSIQGNILKVKYSFNTYRGLDLPVLTSYTLFHTQQLEFKVTGGALFNLATWFRGDVLDTNFKPVALHLKDDTKGAPQSTVWKRSLGTSLYSSVTLYGQVAPKLQLGMEPYVGYELSPVNRAVSIYTERFITAGLMFSARFQLGR